MRSPLRAAVPLALAAGLVATVPAFADSTPPPAAHASGSPTITLIYPSLVQVRIDRTERAIKRATKQFENDAPAAAAAPLKVVRRQMAAAWRGAKYVIRTTPPPPAEEARVHVRAHASGDPTGPTYATPPETAYAVLSLQHDVASGLVGLIDGAHGTGLNALATTLNLTNDRRDQALRYIVSVAPPAPPAEDLASAAQDDGAVPTFDTVMPNLLPMLDDELQAIEGTKSDATDLTAGGRRLLTAADTQVSGTRGYVNTNWPPVPAED